MLGNSNFVGIKIQSELIQLLQAKTVATFSKIRLGEKSFSHSAGKKCFLYKKKGKKKIILQGKNYNFLLILWRYGCCACHC